MNPIEIGPAPTCETCAQVGADDYAVRSRRECAVFARMLERLFPVPEGVQACFKVKTFHHDFGAYREVVVEYEGHGGIDYACRVERETPERWDPVAQFESLLARATRGLRQCRARGSHDDRQGARVSEGRDASRRDGREFIHGPGPRPRTVSAAMLTVIECGPNFAKVRRPWSCVLRASCEQRLVKSTRRNELRMDGSESVLFTLAKAYHRARASGSSRSTANATAVMSPARSSARALHSRLRPAFRMNSPVQDAVRRRQSLPVAVPSAREARARVTSLSATPQVDLLSD